MLCIWLAVLWVVVLGADPLDLWQAVTVAAVAAAGLAAAQVHLSSVRSAHAMGLLRKARRRHLLLEGHWLRVLVGLGLSAAFGVTVAADVAVAGPSALGWVTAAAVAGFVLSEGLWGRLSNYRPFARRSRAMLFGAILASVAVTLMWVSVVRPASGLTAQPVYMGSSPVLAWIVEVAAYKAWGLERVFAEMPPWLAATVRVVTGAGYFFLAAHAAAGATLAFSVEGRRVLAVSGDDQPERAPALRTAVVAGAAAVLLFGAFRLAALADVGLTRLPSLQEVLISGWTAPADGQEVAPPADVQPPPRSAEATRIAMMDRRERVQKDVIGALVCEAGAAEALNAAEAAAEAALARARDGARDEVAALFDGARSRVPEYLDWYYGLSAEYLRTLAALKGDAAEYLASQTSGRLMPGSGDRLDAVFGDLQDAMAAYQTDRASVLAGCDDQVLPSDAREITLVRRTASTEMPESVRAMYLMDASAQRTFERVSGAAAAGVMGGVIAGYMIKSTSGKMAAKALAKVAAKRATTVLGGMLGGGAIGGAGGSAVPGAGTTIGAIAGGLVGGIAIWVGVDFLELKLEEEIGREQFEADLHAAIDAAEARVLADLKL